MAKERRKQSEEIDMLFESGRIDDYSTKVHGLKSSVKVIGARELSEKAKLLEKAGKDNDLDYIKENHDSMIVLYLSYIDNLSGIK